MMSGCGIAALPEETADGIAEALPNGSLIGQGANAALGQRVDAPAPPRPAGGPFAAEQARLLQPMQCRIDGSLGQFEGAAGAAVDLLDDGVTVRRPARQRRPHDHVEMAFQHFALHGVRLPLAMLGVKPAVFELAGYCPRNTGLRPSRNALCPSLASSLWLIRWNSAPSACSAASSPPIN